MTTTIPEITKLPETETVAYHNWLYSVVPQFPQKSELYSVTTGIYLVGYCRNCDKVFSAPISTDPSALYMAKVGVPKTGCVAK